MEIRFLSKANEYGIIENAYAEGYAKARPPKVSTGKKVAVVGSGPSGLAAADQLNKRGHTVTVFEREDRPGGLLRYGIPNMKLEKQIVDRKIAIMEEEGVEFRTGVNVGMDLKAKDLLKEFDRVVLCLRCIESERYQGARKRCGRNLFCSRFPESYYKERCGQTI